MRVHGIESQFYWLNMTKRNEFQFVWRSSFVYSNGIEKNQEAESVRASANSWRWHIAH